MKILHKKTTNKIKVSSLYIFERRFYVFKEITEFKKVHPTKEKPTKESAQSSQGTSSIFLLFFLLFLSLLCSGLAKQSTTTLD